MAYYISSGEISSGITVSYYTMYIYSGGTANSTTVNSSGYMYISSGGVAAAIKENGGYVYVADGANASFASNTISGLTLYYKPMTVHQNTVANSTTVNSGGSMYIYNGGVANSTTINSGGSMYISSGGTANSTTINSGGNMDIYSGGVANSTTINSGGNMSILWGGVANSTTVNSGVSMSISWDGVANSTTINSGGNMSILWGGVANSTTVNSSGNMYISSGGTATAIKENGGYVYVADGANASFVSNTISGLTLYYTSMTVHQNTVANSTTVKSDGYMFIYSGGTASSTTISSGGCMYISSGGTASSTTISSGGHMYISSGGTANSTTINSRGHMYISSGGTANSTTINSSSYMYIRSGGTANSTTVNSGGYMFIYSGGTANSTTVNSSSYMSIDSGGVANNTVNSGGHMYISSGGVANSTTVNSSGTMHIDSGGVANSTTVNSRGYMDIDSGGTASSTTVNSGGNMRIYFGGVHRGSLQITSGAVVSAYSGGKIDFTVAERTASDGYLINDLSLVRGAPTYTITVSTTQAEGTYKLAQGAANFNKTISIGDGTTNYGSITVNGAILSNNGVDYHLIQESGNLILNIGDMIAPTAPTATASTTAPTNRDVTVTATFSSDSTVKQYKIGDGNWTNYTAPFAVSANATIALRAQDAAGNESTGSLVIANIDKVPPVITISCDDTMPYADLIHLTANVTESNLASTEYAIGSGSWQTYTAPVEINANGTIHFRATDTAGNVTVSSYAVTNIGNGEVKIYSSGVLSSRSPIASGKTLTSIHRMDIYSGGIANSTIINSGGVMNIYNRGTANSTTVNSGGDMCIFSGGAANNTTVSGGTMTISSGGVANSTTVHSGGSMYISNGGAASNTTVNADGVFLLSSGGSAVNLTLSRYASASITDAFISNLNMASRASAAITNGLIGGVVINSSATLHCSASDRNHFITLSGGTVYSNGKIIASSGAAVSNVTVSKAGTLHLENGGQAYATLIREEGIFTMLGVANSTTLHGGSMYVGDSSYQNYDGTGGNPTSNVYDEDIHASNNTLNSSWLHVYSGGTATNNVVNSNSWLHVYYGGTATSNVINSSGYITVQDSGTANTAFVHSGGFMRLYTGAILQGEVNVGGKVTVHTAGTSATEDVIRAYGAQIDYLVSERTAQDESIITNLGMIMGATFFATVKSNQTAGTYRLADGAGDFDGNITIRNESGTVYGTLSVNGADITYNGVTYSLDQADGNLTLTVTGGSASGVSNLTGNATGVSWSGNGSAFVVEYSLNNFASVLQLETATSAVDTYQMPGGDWQVRVDSAAQIGFTAAAPAGSAAQIVSDADGNLDVFFARTAGTWTSRHAARHAGTLNGWRGTNERVALTGKNIITDVFAGSTDANVLVLTDDTNGDALFLDDAFTALGNQARLGNIDEIRAGAGNDVIDLTSPKFAYLGDEMTVFGGAGDDTIWANSGVNILYGDAGNDHIIGGAGNDFIIGGAGNDTLHGGGGNDTFCFGANWGTDTVEQLANGKVILRFETGSLTNWNATTKTYTSGNNTVTVTGTGDIELYFGTASTLPEDAFAPSASSKIFEQLA